MNFEQIEAIVTLAIRVLVSRRQGRVRRCVRRGAVCWPWRSAPKLSPVDKENAPGPTNPGALLESESESSKHTPSQSRDPTPLSPIEPPPLYNSVLSHAVRGGTERRPTTRPGHALGHTPLYGERGACAACRTSGIYLGALYAPPATHGLAWPKRAFPRTTALLSAFCRAGAPPLDALPHIA
jgi:hypothetical protein